MRLLSGALCLGLAGCMTTGPTVEQINAQRAAQDQECRAKGYKPGTQDYQTCVALVANQQMGQNAMVATAQSAAFVLPLAVLGAFISDERLKEDVVKVATRPDGITLYRFRYLGGQQEFVGVLAQEVMRVHPDAVFRGADGYLRVAYGRIGARLMTWDEWRMSASAVE